jgi:hypothetical protein
MVLLFSQNLLISVLNTLKLILSSVSLLKHHIHCVDATLSVAKRTVYWLFADYRVVSDAKNESIFEAGISFLCEIKSKEFLIRLDETGTIPVPTVLK